MSHSHLVNRLIYHDYYEIYSIMSSRILPEKIGDNTTAQLFSTPEKVMSC